MCSFLLIYITSFSTDFHLWMTKQKSFTSLTSSMDLTAIEVLTLGTTLMNMLVMIVTTACMSSQTFMLQFDAILNRVINRDYFSVGIPIKKNSAISSGII